MLIRMPADVWVGETRRGSQLASLETCNRTENGRVCVCKSDCMNVVRCSCCLQPKKKETHERLNSYFYMVSMFSAESTSSTQPVCGVHCGAGSRCRRPREPPTPLPIARSFALCHSLIDNVEANAIPRSLFHFCFFDDFQVMRAAALHSWRAQRDKCRTQRSFAPDGARRPPREQ